MASVTGHATNPGDMTLDDLKTYRVEERPALCGPYRSYKVCGMGPPSSGQVAVQQILGILQQTDMAALKPGPEAVHWISEAGRLAYADRALYLADPGFRQRSGQGSDRPGLSEEPRRARRPGRSMGKAKPGEPPFQKTFRWGASEGIEFGTSHMSIVDRDGKAVSMTTTIEDGFGARLMTKSGFLLNNELTDFSFATRRRREAGGEPGRGRQAAPQLDGADHRSRPGQQALRRRRIARRQPDHQLRREDARGHPRLEARSAGGRRPSECGKPQRPDRTRGRDRGGRMEGGTGGEGPRGQADRPEFRHSRHRGDARGLVGGADSRREGVAIGN